MATKQYNFKNTYREEALDAALDAMLDAALEAALATEEAAESLAEDDCAAARAVKSTRTLARITLNCMLRIESESEFKSEAKRRVVRWSSGG